MLRPILRHSRLARLRPNISTSYIATRGIRKRSVNPEGQKTLQEVEAELQQRSTRNVSHAPSEQPATQQPTPQPPQKPSMENILANTSDKDNLLLAPVHIPEDPNSILKSDHPARNILAESGIVVQRQIEMMNVFLGFEQANRYVILDPHGNHIGYIAEHDGGFGKALARQWARTHRSFTTHIFDRHSKEVLRFHRPFSWINTQIRVYDATEASTSTPVSSSTSLTTSANANDIEALQQISQIPTEAMRLIGETHSEWAPLRRKYHLFLAHDLPPSHPEPIRVQSQQNQDSQSQSNEPAPILKQFAAIDEPFLSWDFSLKDSENKLIGSVNRGFGGFAREIFTDTGSYALRMDSAGLEQEAEKSHIISKTHRSEKAYATTVGGENDKSGMSLDQRAVMLATAVTVDFDYFSRHSRSGGMGFMPLWMGGGGEAAGGAAAGEAAGAAGAGEAAGGVLVGGAGRAVGGAAGAGGVGEGAIAGAGTMAGYEAMQRGMGRDQDASPQAGQPTDASPEAGQPYEQPYGQPYDSQSPQSGFPEGEGGDVWGTSDHDPWSEASSNAGDGGGSEGGGGVFQSLWDAFFGD